MATVTINTSKVLSPPNAVLRFQGGSSVITISQNTYIASLDASASSVIDGAIVSYIWERQIDGGDWVQFNSTTFPTTQHTITQTGTYKFRVKLIDSNNLEATSNEITLNFTKAATVACDAFANGVNFTTTFIAPLEAQFTLDATDSDAGDADASIVSYFWEITAQPSGANESIVKETAAITNTSNLSTLGTYSIRLTIVSSNGTTDEVLIRVEVKDTDENGNYL